MATTVLPNTGTAYCEYGDHYAPADTVTPGHYDPAMRIHWIESQCDDCLDDQVAAYYG